MAPIHIGCIKVIRNIKATEKKKQEDVTKNGAHFYARHNILSQRHDII